MFPLTGTKNGADIRLATDVVDDLARFPHLTHVLVAAGDSDYLSVAQKARRSGRQVLGVGVAGSIGRYWEAACDEFRRYDNLLKIGRSVDGIDPSSSLDPQELMVRSMRLCEQQRGSERVPLPVLKQVMGRLSPGFDEHELGFKNFSGFLLSHPKLVATDSNKNYVWLVHEESPSAISEATDLPATMVDRCRAQLPFLSPTVWPLTDLILEQVVTALRTLWDLLMTEDCEAIPHSEWNNRLIAQSMLRADAVRSRAIAVNILPVATRSDTETTIPNPDLEQLEAADLIGRLRQGIILRMHLRCPEATAGGSGRGPPRRASHCERSRRLPSDHGRVRCRSHAFTPPRTRSDGLIDRARLSARLAGARHQRADWAGGVAVAHTRRIDAPRTI